MGTACRKRREEGTEGNSCRCRGHPGPRGSGLTSWSGKWVQILAVGSMHVDAAPAMIPLRPYSSCPAYCAPSPGPSKQHMTCGVWKVLSPQGSAQRPLGSVSLQTGQSCQGSHSPHIHSPSSHLSFHVKDAVSGPPGSEPKTPLTAQALRWELTQSNSTQPSQRSQLYSHPKSPSELERGCQDSAGPLPWSPGRRDGTRDNSQGPKSQWTEPWPARDQPDPWTGPFRLGFVRSSAR